MPHRFDGKVALVTGAARGQGRSHAVGLAAEGADVVAVDICRQIESVAYPLADPDDLAETVRLVESHGRKALAVQADVRDPAALADAVAQARTRFGGLDVVLANAGIGMMRRDLDAATAFRDQIEVNLFGVWNTVQAAAPVLLEQGRGGAVVVTSSTLGVVGRGGDGSGGNDGYAASKHGVIGLMHTWAHWLAPHAVTCNAVVPAGAATPMVLNDAVAELFADAPSTSGADVGNLLDVPLIDPAAVTDAVLYLASARQVTGVVLPVDAGYLAK